MSLMYLSLISANKGEDSTAGIIKDFSGTRNERKTMPWSIFHVSGCQKWFGVRASQLWLARDLFLEGSVPIIPEYHIPTEYNGRSSFQNTPIPFYVLGYQFYFYPTMISLRVKKIFLKVKENEHLYDTLNNLGRKYWNAKQKGTKWELFHIFDFINGS